MSKHYIINKAKKIVYDKSSVRHTEFVYVFEMDLCHNFTILLSFLQGATTGEIKRAYRKLSLIYHPDRETGDPKKFMRIAKAYAA